MSGNNNKLKNNSNNNGLGINKLKEVNSSDDMRKIKS